MEATKKIIKLTGDAPKPVEVMSNNIDGNIHAPHTYLKHCPDCVTAVFDPNHSYVCVNLEERTISFHGNTHQSVNTTVVGKLLVNPIIDKIGINKDRTYSLKEFEKSVRFWKHYFKAEVEWLAVMSEISKVVINMSASAIDTNTRNEVVKSFSKKIDWKPIEFALEIPLFSGETKKYSIPVTIWADIHDTGAKVWLESLDLNMLIDIESDIRLAAEKKKIEDLVFYPVICK